jgi:hypothetical protein
MVYFFHLQADPPPYLIHQFLSAVSNGIVVALKFCYFFLFTLSKSETNKIISPQQKEIHRLYPLNN